MLQVIEAKVLKPYVDKWVVNKKTGKKEKKKVQIYVGVRVQFSDVPPGLSHGQRVFIQTARSGLKPATAHGTQVVYSALHNTFSVTSPTSPTRDVLNRIIEERGLPVVTPPHKNGDEKGAGGLSPEKFVKTYPVLAPMVTNAIQQAMLEEEAKKAA